MVAPYFDFRKLENEDLIQSVCGEDYSEHFVDHLLDLMNGKDIAETVDGQLVTPPMKGDRWCA